MGGGKGRGGKNRSQGAGNLSEFFETLIQTDAPPYGWDLQGYFRALIVPDIRFRMSKACTERGGCSGA
jgi:hypothetical protein